MGRIAVGTGPGSFTGLRIGIATARALAAALGTPAVGVGTLDALALGMREAAGGQRDLLAALDARRGELFAALYGADGSPLREPFLATPGELAEFVSGLSDRRWPPVRGRYDFGAISLAAAPRSRASPIPCIESPPGTFAPSAQQVPGRGRSNRDI